jgi:hypothetical protein
LPWKNLEAGVYGIQVSLFAGVKGAQFLVHAGMRDSVLISFSTRARTDGQAIRSVAQSIRDAELTWIDPSGEQWIIDLDDLKGPVTQLANLDWAKGKARVAPEFDLRETPGFGFTPPIVTGTVTCRVVPESIIVPSPEPTMSTPTAFMSYSWDDESHKAWVRDLAGRLWGDGVKLTLDRWAVAPGDQLPKFMETAVRENDFVLIVCTPNYKLKSDGRKGGVGYEGDIMTGEVFAGKEPRKFIPLLRSGNWQDASPSWLAGKYGIDLRGDPYLEVHYEDLLNTLHGMREQAPPLGARPVRPGGYAARVQGTVATPPTTDSGLIRITGIIADEAGSPRNDGTSGSALYRIPFRLSRRPSADWAQLFVQTWNLPPSFSTMHRPGIARVEGDRIILDGTTIEEVEKYHRETLKSVVERVNQLIAEHEARRRRQEDVQAEQQRQHRQAVEEVAKRISFD